MALDGTPIKIGRPLKPVRLFVDQHDRVVYARTTKELREQARGRFSKMYVDKTVDGKRLCLHTGYVVGARWFTEYQPVERTA